MVPIQSRSHSFTLSKLLQLQLQNFRNIDQASLQFAEGTNIIVGDNAAGKTSLIEALWVLSSGRSFRTAKPQQMIQQQQPQMTLFAAVAQSDQTHKLGLARTEDSLTLKLDGESIASQIEMAAKLPVQLLTPESHRLLEEGPKARRQFMDWGCFHDTPQFIPLWRHYQRALKQRNHALKQKRPKAEVTLWDEQLIDAAYQVDAIRKNYVTSLQPYLLEFCQALMPEIDSTADCQYRPGWPLSQPDLAKFMTENYHKDSLQGHTQYGCHRADIKFRFDGQDAMLKLSRGQQKLFVCALLLAQASLYEKQSGEPVIMLIDDLPAELDANHRETLLKLLDMLNIQSILTTTALDLIPTTQDKNSQAWEISAGTIKPLATD